MKNSIFRRSLATLRRARSSALTGGVLFAGAAFASQGCLQRDVVKQKPNTSNVFVDQLINDSIDEIDLLFVIDNSVSMADKQEILKDAVPQMVQRLINPPCINNDDGTAVPANPTEPYCNSGYSREFNPIDDIHIGVISSSLGGHGSPFCARDEIEEDTGIPYNKDDRGYLMPKVRPDDALVDDPAGSGFLSWNGGDQDANALVTNFAAHVEAAGERGCGFEATLEAWYRFLVDPEPPAFITLNDDSEAIMGPDPITGEVIDSVLLAQREQFLRPEGLVAIVVLSDENDCSAMDGGNYYDFSVYGHLVTDPTRPMVYAAEVCETNPNDQCCYSCQLDEPPAGCAVAQVCIDTAKAALPAKDDRGNVRCYQNKRRFGVDLLYPTSRYVDALSKTKIANPRDFGNLVDNPLLTGAGEKANRAPGLVFFAGIVGLPWQDVATDDSLDVNNGIMKYRTAEDLLVTDPVTLNNRWDAILGKPGIAMSDKRCTVANPPAACGLTPTPPLDPFMLESIAERDTSLSNPISGDFIVASTSNNPRENGINGHEADHSVTGQAADGEAANDDLQYACTFPLATPKMDCAVDDYTCDCSDEVGDNKRNRPLCQPDGGGASGTTQYWGKAYPGTRILQVLRDFGDNSIVGSICPKITVGDKNDVNFGYNPAVQAIVDRLKEKLGGKCLPREVSTSPDGSVPCTVVEARPLPSDGIKDLTCEASNGRAEVDPATRPAVIKQLRDLGNCDGSSGFSCSSYQMCEIEELLDEENGRNDCLYTAIGGEASLPNAGFCYIDPAKFVEDADGNKTYPAGGDPAFTGEAGKNPVVDNCDATERRLLRFVGEKTPAADTTTFVACSGDAASADAPIQPPPVDQGEPEPEEEDDE